MWEPTMPLVDDVKNIIQAYLLMTNQKELYDLVTNREHNKAKEKAESIKFKASNFFTSHTKYISDAITLHQNACSQENPNFLINNNDLLNDLESKFKVEAKARGGMQKFIQKMNDNPGDYHFLRMIASVLKKNNIAGFQNVAISEKQKSLYSQYDQLGVYAHKQNQANQKP